MRNRENEKLDRIGHALFFTLIIVIIAILLN